MWKHESLIFELLLTGPLHSNTPLIKRINVSSDFNVLKNGFLPFH